MISLFDANALRMQHNAAAQHEATIDKAIREHACKGWPGDLVIRLYVNHALGEFIAGLYKHAGYVAAYTDQTGDRLTSEVVGTLRIGLPEVLRAGERQVEQSAGRAR